MAYASRLYPRAEPRGFTLQRINLFPPLVSRSKFDLKDNPITGKTSPYFKVYAVFYALSSHIKLLKY